MKNEGAGKLAQHVGLASRPAIVSFPNRTAKTLPQHKLLKLSQASSVLALCTSSPDAHLALKSYGYCLPSFSYGPQPKCTHRDTCTPTATACAKRYMPLCAVWFCVSKAVILLSGQNRPFLLGGQNRPFLSTVSAKPFPTSASTLVFNKSSASRRYLPCA